LLASAGRFCTPWQAQKLRMATFVATPLARQRARAAWLASAEVTQNFAHFINDSRSI
jgi:hypothetical protein